MNDLKMDQKFMAIAIKEALKAKKIDEVPVGCVLVKDGIVISKAHNKVMRENSAIFHAEIIAIEKCGKKIKDFRLDGITLYVTLEPCLMCLGAILNSRIDRIVIGCMDLKRKGNLSLDKILFDCKSKIKVTKGVLENECLSLLQDFFKNLRDR